MHAPLAHNAVHSPTSIYSNIPLPLVGDFQQPIVEGVYGYWLWTKGSSSTHDRILTSSHLYGE